LFESVLLIYKLQRTGNDLSVLGSGYVSCRIVTSTANRNEKYRYVRKFL